MGDTSRGHGFPPQMLRLWSSDHDTQKTGGEEYQTGEEARVMEPDKKRICKKCLLQDFAPEEYLESMRIYLNGLDEGVKTEDTLYRDRLSRCEECDKLSEGLCRLCGCFVEYRAAIKHKKCPDSYPKW